MREAFLKAAVLGGTACVGITEALSLFHVFTRAGVILGWVAVIAVAIPFVWRTRWKLPPIGLVDGVGLAAIAAILAVTGFTALSSAPNSADAMAYHLPRVIYWIQQRSVAFFPTTYLNQISLQPFAEYAMAHTYLISGGDRFVNLVQFAGFAGSAVAVSSIAQALGSSFRAQVIGALICATLPHGILQASGAKNDCWMALWLACAVYFAARGSFGFLGLALGLAIGTKATAYLFAPPVLIAIWVMAGKPRLTWRSAVVIGAGLLSLNAPQFVRNYQLSGSILGYDSAFGDGSFRWRNEIFGWKPTVSNALRNISEQLGGRSEERDRLVYAAVLRMHAALDMDPQDPRTTWPGEPYGPPKNANHEADANNRWHLLLAVIAFAAAAFRPSQRKWLVYGAGLAIAFFAFCFYLKWQQFFSRLELPLFVLAAPLIASLLDGLRPAILPFAVCLFLIDGTRHPLLDNWTRPLRGPNRLSAEPRDLQYFNDMTQFHNRDFYFEARDRVLASGCETVGIDINRNQLEYPLQALLLERNRNIRFVHVDVTNASRRYFRPSDPQPCITIEVR